MFRDEIKINLLSLLICFRATATELKFDEKRFQKDDRNSTLREYYETDILTCIYLVGIMLLTYFKRKRISAVPGSL